MGGNIEGVINRGVITTPGHPSHFSLGGNKNKYGKKKYGGN